MNNVTYFVNVTATDEFGLSVSSILEIYVDTNYPPFDLNPNLVLNYTFRAGQWFKIILPRLFKDPEDD